jgi:alpha-L-arabinofuranosidase
MFFMMMSGNKISLKLLLLFLMGCLWTPSVFAQASITVDLNKSGHDIPRTLWGIFFEDINLSADGGIYPELVRNRSFEDGDQPDYWKLTNDAGSQCAMAVDGAWPLNTFNPHCLRVTVDGAFTLENDGYWGMNVVRGNGYTFRVAVRAADGFAGPLNVKIVSSTGSELAGGEISNLTSEWKYHEIKLAALDSDPQAKLQISAAGKGTLFLDMVSLMPDGTWKHHGLRVDLAEALDALHPSFMRFPGGNWIEGDDLAHMYHWKSTVGPIDTRTPLWNTWGYNTTQGLGFEEYLQLCEDLGAEPLFDINCGMSLHDSVPRGQMGQWVQDALDAIQFVSGTTNTVWGALRAQNGHPQPFSLNYLEVGNENGGSDYWERWRMVADAVRAKYPSVKLIANTDLGGRPYPRDPMPDIVDEHYYESPESFMRRANQYDTYNRGGPKIFVGEYAVTQGAGQGNLRAAIGEAAFMTGIERNSDVVTMASYAPLFVNVNHRAWNPDMISFDSSRWFGSPSYYVQQMFSANRGSVTLPIAVDSGEVLEQPPAGEIGVGTWNTEAEFKDIKVTSPDGNTLFASDFRTNSDGWKFVGDGDWKVQNATLQQAAQKENIRALAGDTSWTNYTLQLKARKLGGREGFLILFHIKNDHDRVWWNIGGWNDTRNAVELDGPMDSKPGYIKTGQWYDIKVEVNGISIRCWLDGKLIHEILKPRIATHRLYASAARDNMTGDIILKVVNSTTGPVAAHIRLSGGNDLTGKGDAMVLTSDNQADENSLDNPTHVSPKTEPIDFVGTNLNQTFPGNSFTVLRLGVK